MTKFDLKQVDELIKKYANSYLERDDEVFRAYNYALFSGGKRLRPLLLLNTAASLNCVDKNIQRLAVAMECIHTYSLVHDDLPAMDNDDLRRGKPTVHRMFGEALAILCGDGLLTLASNIIFDGENSQNYFDAARRLFEGAQKMVRGQADDLNANLFIDEGKYFDIVSDKTGGIICDCICIPAVYSGRIKNLQLLEQIGHKIGCLYQVTDDLLDGKKDETSILNFMSQQQATEFLQQMTAEVESQISDFQQKERVDLQHLKHFVEYNVVRKA